MQNKMMVMVAMLLIVVAGGAFFAGMKYQQSQSPRFGNFQGARNGQFPQRTQETRLTNGEIVSQDDKSITVKVQDGGSKIVLLTDTTVINKSAEGAKSDLKMGEKVAVFGKENADGSVTAQNIQLNPVLRGFSGPGLSAPTP